MRYSRNSEFDDIEAVFRRRSEAAGRQPAPRETGLPPAWDAQSPSAWDQPPAPDQPKPETHEQAMRRLCGTVSDDGVSAPKRRRKKHRFARFLLRLTASLLLLILVFVLASVLLAKMPRTDAPIGVRKDGCAAILICGTDESRARTDTMMLLFIDRKAGRMRVLSLPRDTMVNRDNPVPKLNGAYGANGKGEKGMNVLMDNVRDLIGYRPDGYLLLDLDCFETLVDRMGGVDFNVPVDMYYSDPTQNLYIDLKAAGGRQGSHVDHALPQRVRGRRPAARLGPAGFPRRCPAAVDEAREAAARADGPAPAAQKHRDRPELPRPLLAASCPARLRLPRL